MAFAASGAPFVLRERLSAAAAAVLTDVSNYTTSAAYHPPLTSDVVASKTSAALIGLGVLVWALTQMVMLFSCKEGTKRPRSSFGRCEIKRVFHVTAVIAMIARISWFLIDVVGGYNAVATYFLGRISESLFFLMFSLLLAHWVDLFHSKAFVNRVTFRRIMISVIVIDVLFVVQQIAIAVWYTTDFAAAALNGDVFSSAVVSLVIAFVFLAYGSLLYRRLHSTGLVIAGRSNRRKRMLQRIVIITAMLAACLVMRFAAFLYRPITGRFLEVFGFQVFAYIVPEFIPVCLELYALAPNFSEDARPLL